MSAVAKMCYQLKAILVGEDSYRFDPSPVIRTEEQKRELLRNMGVPNNSPLIDFFLILECETMVLKGLYRFQLDDLGSSFYKGEEENLKKRLGFPVQIFGYQDSGFIALKLDGSNEVWAESFAGGIPVSFGTFSDFLQYLINEAHAAINGDEAFRSIEQEADFRVYPEDYENE